MPNYTTKRKLKKLDKDLQKTVAEIVEDEIDVKGDDGGEYGILKVFIFEPDPKKMVGKTQDEQQYIAEKVLHEALRLYSEEIKWYIDPERPPTIAWNEEKKGFMMNSYLKRKKGVGAKKVSEFQEGNIGVNNK